MNVDSGLPKTGNASDVIYYKLSVADLKLCTKSSCGNNWTLVSDTNDRKLNLKIVWILGEIIDLQNDSLQIKDHTGVCHVIADTVVQSSSVGLSTGVYCSVLGQLQQAGNEPVISAMKMTVISHNNILRKMWPLEVEELKQYLDGRVCPSLGNK